MAAAFKCDRCGRLFEDYSSKKYPRIREGKSVMIITRGTNSICDLCIDCINDFENWWDRKEDEE